MARGSQIFNLKHVKNAAELLQLVREVIKSKPTVFWRVGLDEAGVLNASVNTFDYLSEDEQVKACGLVSWVKHQSTGSIPMSKVPALADFEEELLKRDHLISAKIVVRCSRVLDIVQTKLRR